MILRRSYSLRWRRVVQISQNSLIYQTFFVNTLEPCNKFNVQTLSLWLWEKISRDQPKSRVSAIFLSNKIWQSIERAQKSTHIHLETYVSKVENNTCESVKHWQCVRASILRYIVGILSTFGTSIDNETWWRISLCVSSLCSHKYLIATLRFL